MRSIDGRDNNAWATALFLWVGEVDDGEPVLVDWQTDSRHYTTSCRHAAHSSTSHTVPTNAPAWA